MLYIGLKNVFKSIQNTIVLIMLLGMFIDPAEIILKL
jgi:hypothetical protein